MTLLILYEFLSVAIQGWEKWSCKNCFWESSSLMLQSHQISSRLLWIILKAVQNEAVNMIVYNITLQFCQYLSFLMNWIPCIWDWCKLPNLVQNCWRMWECVTKIFNKAWATNSNLQREGYSLFTMIPSKQKLFSFGLTFSFSFWLNSDLSMVNKSTHSVTPTLRVLLLL